MTGGRFRHSTVIEILVIGAVLALIAGLVVTRQNSERQTSNQPDAALITRDTSAETATSVASPVTPTFTVDEYIVIPAANAAGITLMRTNETPLMSQQEAMQAVFSIGVPWGLGEAYQGKLPVVVATYGLATSGSRAADGEWIGDRNLRLSTGEILDHLENRPVWLIDYGNTIFAGSEVSDNHSAYLVDAATGTVLLIWGYNVDTEPPADSHVEPLPTSGAEPTATIP